MSKMIVAFPNLPCFIKNKKNEVINKGMVIGVILPIPR
jgi:hypothetical protein